MTLATILEIEDTMFNWVLTNIPIAGVCILLMCLTWLVRGWLLDFKNRLVKVESEYHQLDKNQNEFRETLVRFENKLAVFDDRQRRFETTLAIFETRLTQVETRLTLVEDRLTRVEDKLDHLIMLISRGKIVFGQPESSKSA